MNAVCSTCGSVIPSDKSYCKQCYDSERKEYQMVKDFLRTKPNSNAIEVANATGITISKITRYIRDGMLTKKENRKY